MNIKWLRDCKVSVHDKEGNEFDLDRREGDRDINIDLIDVDVRMDNIYKDPHNLCHLVLYENEHNTITAYNCPREWFEVTDYEL